MHPAIAALLFIISGEVNAILNGYKVDHGEQPYMAAFECQRENGEFAHCGGAIIGEVDLNNNVGQGQILSLLKPQKEGVKLHSHLFIGVDLAIGITEQPIPIDNINVGSVALAQYDLPVGSTAVISGWGTQSVNPKMEPPPQLHAANVRIMRFEDCLETLKLRVGAVPAQLLAANMLCTDSDNAGVVQPCSGDSGGPLVGGSNGKATIFGVYSRGPKKYTYHSNENSPSFYISVPANRKWIEHVLAGGQ